MISQNILSDKDLQLLKVTYRAVIENYYEHQSQQNVSNIILMNSLIMQSISTRQQSDSLLLVSILEILKVRAKSNKDLSQSIQNTIIHLKNPLQIYLKDNTILESLEKSEIYGLCCAILHRLYESHMKPRSDSYSWKQIIGRISKNCDKNMNFALEAVVTILPDYSNFVKEVSKSGMLKYLCSVYIPQVLQQKISLYKSLKVLKLLAVNDRSVLPNREKNIASVIYHYPAYILIVQQIEDSCYDQQYSQRVLSNTSEIDPIYVWSYNTNFCLQSKQNTIDDLQTTLKSLGKTIPADLQWKIYSIINNLLKNNSFKFIQSWKIPINSDKNLNAYLKLLITEVQKNPNQYKNVDMKAIQYAYDLSKTPDELTNKLIKDLKGLNPTSSTKKIGRLDLSLFIQNSIQKNPQLLMEKATIIPKNSEDLKITEQILTLRQKNSSQIQNDIIRTLKNKALQSLKAGIVGKFPVHFHNLINNIRLQDNNPEVINKLIKLGELDLALNQESAEKYNKQKVLEMIQWLQNNHGISIIDWVAASQMLTFIFGADEWQSHIGEIPNRCFWLLNAVKDENASALFTKLNSIPQSHPKTPLIVGFISKSGDNDLKKLILKSKALQAVVSEVCSFSTSRQSLHKQQTGGQLINRYLRNVLNLSYFIQNWNQSDIREQTQKLIKPCLQNVIRAFNGYQHEFKFLQNCLPYKLNMKQLKDLNLARILETHGKLASYLHQNKYDGKIDFNRLSNLSSQSDPNKILQVLKFLQENPNMVDSFDFFQLLDQMLKNSNRDKKYWRFYPHYMTILTYLSQIVSKSSNSQIIDKLTQVYQKLIGSTAQNRDITEDQLVELYQSIYKGLERIQERKIQIDTNKLKRQAEKIEEKQWKKKINDKLKSMIAVQQKNKGAKVVVQQEIASKQQRVGNKYQKSINPNTNSVTPTKQQTLSASNQVDPRFEASRLVLQKQGVNTSSLNISSLQINKNNFQQRKDEMEEEGEDNLIERMKSEQGKLQAQTTEEKKLYNSLVQLRKIIRKELSKQNYPRLVQIFLASQFNKNKRYILGTLLTEYYEAIQKDKSVIALLQMRDKTNLPSDICYKFLSKYEEAFIITKRWKLEGHEFMDLAMERVQSKTQNKQICVESGCQIGEYNLTTTGDINYFQSKKYHHTVVSIQPKIQNINEALQYFLLIGTSARTLDIKSHYISSKLHLNILQYVNRDWLSEKKIVANLSYALSSLVYTQNHIAIQIASKKQQILKLMEAYRKFAGVKSVVQAACSLFSNICYSNKETKQLLFNYGLCELLALFMRTNNNKPEVSTYKQIIRTLGNISLHKPSSEKLINLHICQLIIEVAEKFNLLIFRDQEKLKVLKLIVDFFSNISTHKLNLEIIHQQGVTNFVVTILETTEITEDQVLMSCIDTIDGLCQNQQIQNYVVMDKKFLLQLIDLLKVKEDEKLITKSIRLLTNMTLNELCIPYILSANLLSVLANIVLSVYRNQKIQTYINKMIIRIFSKKPGVKSILKSGYIDCLIKTIQINDQIDENYLPILQFYCQHIPQYLNNRTFFSMIKMLSKKYKEKQFVQNCFKIIKTIYNSQGREQEDMELQGVPTMYEKLLQNNQISQIDVVYLLGLHCTKSKKLKKKLLSDFIEKKSNLIQELHKIGMQQHMKQLVNSVLFAVLNKQRVLVDVGKEIVKEEDFAYKLLTKGLECKLYRQDGSTKDAIIDINEMYVIRAYKLPDGQIKRKYTISIRQLKDWQYFFEPNDQFWKTSIFLKSKRVFESSSKIQNCVSLLGSHKWGEFSLINIQFVDAETKIKFIKAISALIISFRV